MEQYKLKNSRVNASIVENEAFLEVNGQVIKLSKADFEVLFKPAKITTTEENYINNCETFYQTPLNQTEDDFSIENYIKDCEKFDFNVLDTDMTDQTDTWNMYENL